MHTRVARQWHAPMQGSCDTCGRIKGMVTWAKENAAASGLANAPIRYLVDDCVKFVEREIRRGNHYDAIIMDPPSYGRGPKGEIWKNRRKNFPTGTALHEGTCRQAIIFRD